RLKVAELFTSLQGEGEVIGLPSHFIRCYGCDLTCQWCDTKYTWVGQDRAVEGREYRTYTVDELLAWIARAPRARWVTITGGEPLLQPIGGLCVALDRAGYQIVIETNGLHPPPPTLCELVAVWSVSPKLSNAHVAGTWGPLDWLGKVHRYYLKFVIQDPMRDLPEVEAFVAARGFSADHVVLQPDGLASAYEEALRRLAEVTRDLGLGFRVLPQLHRILWGLNRGH
ncbi:MAG: 7-carboxy-7-deazaguanine synthase QueE, partial [Candidatus Methylomirabilales bacterium]